METGGLCKLQTLALREKEKYMRRRRRKRRRK